MSCNRILSQKKIIYLFMTKKIAWKLLRKKENPQE